MPAASPPYGNCCGGGLRWPPEDVRGPIDGPASIFMITFVGWGSQWKLCAREKSYPT